MTKHPNAVIGGLAGVLGSLLVWLVNDQLHWNVPATACAAIAGGIAFAILFVGRRGIRGTLSAIWNGSK
jgi:uncharacterized membrane protein YjjB (DUF3815 family)